MSSAGGRLKDEGTKLQVVAAGATAGLISRFVIAPLDVVKIRLQLQPHTRRGPLQSPHAYRGPVATVKHILQHEGVTGLWKGNIPAELMYVCYASIQFTTYRSVTQVLQSGALFSRRLPDSVESFVAGATAGAVSTTATYPLDLLRTRFAAQGTQQVYKSLLGAIREIHQDEGWRGFFRGIGPGLAQIVPFMGIFFVSYEGLRSSMRDRQVLQAPWGGGEATAGALASVLAKTAVFPLDLVRKRIQVQGPTRNRYAWGDMPEYRSAGRALAAIVRSEGVRGLYKGLPISLIKAAPASAVTVWTYERVLKLMMSWEEGERDQVV